MIPRLTSVRAPGCAQRSALNTSLRSLEQLVMKTRQADIEKLVAKLVAIMLQPEEHHLNKMVRLSSHGPPMDALD